MRYPRRQDGVLAYSVDPEAPPKAPAWRRFQVRDQRHPFRGAAARLRAQCWLKTQAAPRRARQANGQSWDKCVDRCNRRKDWQGQAIVSQLFVTSFAADGLTPRPRGAIAAALARLAARRCSRVGLPVVARPGSAVYEQAVMIARGVQAS